MAKTDAEKEAAKAAKEAEKEAAKAAKESRDAVSVVWGNGRREYSRKVHGDDFADLARQFAEKVRGEVV